jgi:hypothetical protein
MIAGWSIGDAVKHPIQGRGEVVMVADEGRTLYVKWAYLPTVPATPVPTTECRKVVDPVNATRPAPDHTTEGVGRRARS